MEGASAEVSGGRMPLVESEGSKALMVKETLLLFGRESFKLFNSCAFFL